jgi:hypothetical protein
MNLLSMLNCFQNNLRVANVECRLVTIHIKPMPHFADSTFVSKQKTPML